MPTRSPVMQPTRSSEVARLELTRLPPEAPLDTFLNRVCEVSADTLDVERTGIWLFIDDRSAIRCANLFERSKSEHSSGAILRVADFPTYFSSLSQRKAVPAEVAEREPWTAELAAAYMQPLGIGSILDAGIFVNGTLVGVVCHEHVGQPREWSTEARDFAGSVADLVALRIQSAEVRDLRAAFLTQQERLAHLDKHAALEHMAAAIAHDFRNLLTVFLGQGELMLERLDLPRDVREQAQVIIDAAVRGNELASSLLEFARPTEKVPTVIDLATLTTELLPMLKASVGMRHEVQLTAPAELGKVLIDGAQYSRILLNLVINARDAMPAGGLIHLKLASVKITSNPSYAGRFVLLEVADHGAGIDATTRERIFEPFFTTKSHGTGLGLAIVRQAVERAGGFIRVDSEAGQGTSFRLFFPGIEAGTGESPVLAMPAPLDRWSDKSGEKGHPQ